MFILSEHQYKQNALIGKRNTKDSTQSEQLQNLIHK